MTDLSLTVTRTIAAPAQKVFDAWLDPQMLARFIRPMPGMEAPQVTNDPTEGGAFEIVMTTPNGDIPHAGLYKEITPHSRIVFTWDSPFTAEGSTVTLDFAEANGVTDVTLTHVIFPSEDSRDSHNTGWTQILDTLAEVA